MKHLNPYDAQQLRLKIGYLHHGSATQALLAIINNTVGHDGLKADKLYEIITDAHAHTLTTRPPKT